MEKRKKLKPIWKILIVAVIICGVIVVDSRIRLTVTEYELGSERLPEEFDGFCIVQLSDVHGEEFGKDNAALVKKVSASDPDIIALTGDLADGETDMESVETLLAQLVEIAPCYYVSGNHEWSAGLISELETMFDKYGVRYLRNDHSVLEKQGAAITIAGVEDPNGMWDMPKPDEAVDIIKGERPDDYIVLLGHRNYWLEEYPGLEVDIIMCGHAHGGIIRLPLIGAVLGTGLTLFPEHTEGVIAGEHYDMVVSRGLGSSVPIPRFLNNPEIVVLKLRSE